MKKLFVWMTALNVAALALVVSGSTWLAKTHMDKAKAINKNLNAEEKRRAFELDMKSADNAEAEAEAGRIAWVNCNSRSVKYGKVERSGDGLVVLFVNYDNSVDEKLPLGQYKERIQKKIAEQDAVIKNADADLRIAAVMRVLAIIVIAIGLGFGLSAFVLFVLFVLTLLDRLDALACLPQMLKNEAEMSAKLMSVERYMAALAANSNEINGNVAELDKHVCAGINWFGENLPKILTGCPGEDGVLSGA